MTCWEMQKILTVYYEKYTRALREQYQLSRLEFDILMFLAENPEEDTAADLVRAMMITKSHASLAVGRLKHLGYITCVCRAGNRKSLHIRLQDASLPIIDAGRMVHGGFLNQLTDGLTEGEKEQFGSLFARVCRQAQDGLKELVQAEACEKGAEL